jgi:hypothetical protein
MDNVPGQLQAEYVFLFSPGLTLSARVDHRGQWENGTALQSKSLPQKAAK